MGAPQQVILGSKGKSLVFLTSDAVAATSNTRTFTGVSIGAATAVRRVIVGVMGAGGAGGNIDSVTIGGVAATVVLRQNSNACEVGIVVANVTTGTTGDIVLTFTGVKDLFAIMVWVTYDLTSDTAVDSDSHTAANPLTKTLDSSAGGFCVGVVAIDEATTVSWAAIAEDVDGQIGGNRTYSGAHGVTATTSITPAATFAAASTARSGVFATW